MPLVVETGAGLPDANVYVSVAQADAYHAARGNMAWAEAEDDNKGAAIVRATTNLDATYRDRFPGYPAMGRQQGLEWPRIGAFTEVSDNGRSDAYLSNGYGYGGIPLGFYQIPSNTIPREIIAATCEAAARELMAPGSLAPDLDQGGAIQRLKAGSVEVQYVGGAAAQTVYQGVELALASLLLPARTYTGRAVRG